MLIFITPFCYHILQMSLWLVLVTMHGNIKIRTWVASVIDQHDNHYTPPTADSVSEIKYLYTVASRAYINNYGRLSLLRVAIASNDELQKESWNKLKNPYREAKSRWGNDIILVSIESSFFIVSEKIKDKFLYYKKKKKNIVFRSWKRLTALNNFYKSEIWAPCHNQTPSWYWERRWTHKYTYLKIRHFNTTPKGKWLFGDMWLWNLSLEETNTCVKNKKKIWRYSAKSLFTLSKLTWSKFDQVTLTDFDLQTLIV